MNWGYFTVPFVKYDISGPSHKFLVYRHRNFLRTLVIVSHFVLNCVNVMLGNHTN